LSAESGTKSRILPSETISSFVVEQALEKARVQRIFGSWVSEARTAFLTRNLPGIPIEKFALYGETQAKLTSSWGEVGRAILRLWMLPDSFSALYSPMMSLLDNLYQRSIYREKCHKSVPEELYISPQTHLRGSQKCYDPM
jgi:hypothetical protein